MKKRLAMLEKLKVEPRHQVESIRIAPAIIPVVPIEYVKSLL